MHTVRLAVRLYSTAPKYIAAAHKRTNNPLWRLLDALRQPRHLLGLSDALHRNGVSTDEYSRWKHEQNMAALPRDVPSWLVLHLISSKVRTAQHAHGPMLNLVYAHLDTAPKQVHGPLLLLAAVQLARFNLVVPLRRITQTFLHTWIEDPAVYFNLLLQVISSVPNRTVESANIAVLLLKAMESRQLKLTSETYEALLDDRFVTLQLTKYLQTRMVQEGFVPQTAHLEAYLRVFAKDGVIHDARRYYDAIHSREPKPDPTSSLLDPSSVPQIRANTLMLGSYPETSFAFGFLRKLASSNPTPTMIPPPPHNPHYKTKIRPITRLMRTKFLSIHDLTAALCVAVRDPKCNSPHLMKLFDRAPGGRPTVATYTILIRGLLLRGDTVNAVSYWKKLLKSGLTIDSEALATGVVALTRAKRPYDAFMLLEQFGARPDPTNGIIHLRQPVKVTSKTINDYMVALNRIQRPDVVFHLWDHMSTLYAVQPNTLTLSILLQSARLAHRLDDTLSGALAHLSLKNPFRTKPTTQHPDTISPCAPARDASVSTIRSLLYDTAKSKPRAYVNGIWRGTDPASAARNVYLQALFGMAVEQDNDGENKVREMLKLEAPASATRSSVDDDPASGFGFSLRRKLGGAMPYVFEPPSDLFLTPPPDSDSNLDPQINHARVRIRSHHPSVLPTSHATLNYILLLHLSSRAGELPLLLAWMKYLGIQPSKALLAVALAAWSEVSVYAPLVERWHHGRGSESSRVIEGSPGSSSGDGGGDDGKNKRKKRSEMIGPERGREYVRLVEWLVDWVGEVRMPTEIEVGKWERVLEKAREVR
ncbi:hypothetical protein P691DRAFT_773656 [Macrolepiota fuliginosa MF-IS2]|uniref:Pentatricopeptide repeat protein n=1 Tax=Macrolepiota fuliginosa MF-IS2 TaxID=1400762 RepID=A0A9P5XI34_9AGAR|nr:hypothetical protein P691DRAFT_773656 [Macrolepiota fuliginosa MF-IS2]